MSGTHKCGGLPFGRFLLLARLLLSAFPLAALQLERKAEADGRVVGNRIFMVGGQNREADFARHDWRTLRRRSDQ